MSADSEQARATVAADEVAGENTNTNTDERDAGESSASRTRSTSGDETTSAERALRTRTSPSLTAQLMRSVAVLEATVARSAADCARAEQRADALAQQLRAADARVAAHAELVALMQRQLTILRRQVRDNAAPAYVSFSFCRTRSFLPEGKKEKKRKSLPVGDCAGFAAVRQ